MLKYFVLEFIYAGNLAGIFSNRKIQWPSLVQGADHLERMFAKGFSFCKKKRPLEIFRKQSFLRCQKTCKKSFLSKKNQRLKQILEKSCDQPVPERERGFKKAP
jgi:hypothetical protein